MCSVSNHYILQYIMNAGFVSYNQVLDYYKSLLESQTDDSQRSQKNFDSLITEINNAVKPYDLEIKKGVCEITGTVYFIFMNTAVNEFSKIQGEYKEKDLQLFKVMIDEIMKSPEMQLTQEYLIHLFEKYGISYSTEKSKEFIDDLVLKGYFYELENEAISFGIRLIYECDTYLRDSYSHILKECTLCKELVFVGCVCKSCQILLHNHCFEKYVIKRNKCPNCNENLMENVEKSIKRLKIL